MNITKEKLCELVYDSINESLRPGERSSNYGHGIINTAVDEVFFVLGENLKNQNSVEIRGFGRFSIHERKTKKGRNFKTGEAVLIPPRNVIKFNPSPALYEPISKKIACENELDCPMRISTTIKNGEQPIRICRYHYRCPSRTQDLFQNDTVFSKNARVLEVTVGELVSVHNMNKELVPVAIFNVPVVLVYCESKPSKQKVRVPEYFVLVFSKDSVRPTFNSGPANVSFNYQINKCYVRNSNFDLEFDIAKHSIKYDEVLKILLNAKFYIN